MDYTSIIALSTYPNTDLKKGNIKIRVYCLLLILSVCYATVATVMSKLGLWVSIAVLVFTF
jgi:hypothetical protein